MNKSKSKGPLLSHLNVNKTPLRVHILHPFFLTPTFLQFFLPFVLLSTRRHLCSLNSTLHFPWGSNLAEKTSKVVPYEISILKSLQKMFSDILKILLEENSKILHAYILNMCILWFFNNFILLLSLCLSFCLSLSLWERQNMYSMSNNWIPVYVNVFNSYLAPTISWSWASSIVAWTDPTMSGWVYIWNVLLSSSRSAEIKNQLISISTEQNIKFM